VDRTVTVPPLGSAWSRADQIGRLGADSDLEDGARVADSSIPAVCLASRTLETRLVAFLCTIDAIIHSRLVETLFERVYGVGVPAALHAG
jgi:hypothetical protein